MSKKQLYRSRAGWYSVEYPEGWTVEESEDLVTFYKSETGSGALQISAYRTPGQQDTRQVLLEYLSDQDLTIDSASIVAEDKGRKQFSTYHYVENEWYRQVWVITEGVYLLFVTYNCKELDEENELAEVFGIVNSVVIAPDS